MLSPSPKALIMSEQCIVMFYVLVNVTYMNVEYVIFQSLTRNNQTHFLAKNKLQVHFEITIGRARNYLEKKLGIYL